MRLRSSPSDISSNAPAHAEARVINEHVDVPGSAERLFHGRVHLTGFRDVKNEPGARAGC